MSSLTKASSVLAALSLVALPMWTKPNISDLAHRCHSLGDQKACGKLTELAEHDKDLTVRMQATSSLSDQTVLAKVALEDESGDVRRTAVEKLTDQTVLAKVALEDTDRSTLGNVMQDLDGGIGIVGGYRVRKAAVKRMTDQTALTRVALEEKDFEVRQLAVLKLTDQGLLEKLALDNDKYIREDAIGKLMDQAALARVAVQEKDFEVCRLALSKLTDEALLAKVAVEGADASARNYAVGKLADQALLAKVAVEGADASVSGAVWKLTDQALLARVALEGNNENVRKAAKTALAGGETVENGRAVYIWRSSPTEKGIQAARARLRISSVLGAADLNGDILGPSQSTILLAITSDSADSPLAPGFVVWQFAGEDKNDVCTLESGSIFLGNGNEVRGRISFIGHKANNGKGTWGTSNGRAFVLFRPRLYLKSDETLVLGGWLASYAGAIVGDRPADRPAVTVALSTSVSAMREIPVTVTGTIRFPRDRWTPAGAGFNIKGGGLQFDETGVFLIPGTKYWEDVR